MVKNTHGGSGHKKFGRKFTEAPRVSRLRVKEDEGELYAIVTRLLGNRMFHCFCIDGRVRLGHIRGKFSGRGKRDNMLTGGKWILIGLREWDIDTAKKSSGSKSSMQSCDLLEVYSDSDKLRLKEMESEEWQRLEENDVSKLATDAKMQDDFDFATDKDFERQQFMEEMESATSKKISLKKTKEKEEDHDDKDDEEVNVDDI